MTIDFRSTERFGDRAAAYAAYRPTYPKEAIDAVLDGLGDPESMTIADIGAGTGISAQAFAERGARVIAIEPNEAMRAQAEPAALVEWRHGTGEATGLGDASVDAVAAAQAFHWFATPAAMREFRRIARRRAALLQYERDERSPFTKAYGDCVRAHATDDTESMRMRALAIFSNFPDARVRRFAFTAAQSLDLDGVLGRAASSSYLPHKGSEAVALRSNLREIFDKYSQSGRVTLSTVCFVIVADW